jgi:hypothetical protein
MRPSCPRSWGRTLCPTMAQAPLSRAC